MKYLLLPVFCIFLIDSEPSTAQNINNINCIDRPFIYAFNEKLDNLSAIGTYTSLILTGVPLMGQTKDFKSVTNHGMMLGEAFLLTMATKEFFKLAIDRDRPYTYFEDFTQDPDGDQKNSFPSGHTAYAFMGATFLTSTFLKEFPGSKLKIPVITTSYILATGVGILRVRSGNHFLTDVFAGALIGSLYGWAVPKFHFNNKLQLISIIPMNNRIILSINF